jgi:hypothetical protein
MRWPIVFGLLTAAIAPGVWAAGVHGGLTPPAPTATITSVSVTPSSFFTQSGNANSNVGTLAAVVSVGSFGGSYSLPTSGACTGTDNAKFAISGGLLNIGTTDITAAGTYAVSVLANDANFKNSPFCQALTLTGTVPPTLSLVVTPAAPSIPSTTGKGATVATLQGVWSNAAPFTGSFMFVTPNFDADTYTVSGNNLIVSNNSLGVGGAGGAVQHNTMEAIQIPATADGVTSSAPAGPPLQMASGTWSWGPLQAGRNTGAGSFAGGNVLYLNGTAIGSGDSMEVAHGGQFYMYSSYWGTWFCWSGTAFSGCSGP